MALLSNYPFVLGSWHGTECIFCIYCCPRHGLFLEQALVAVFVEGIIFILLSLTNVREAIFNSIPMTLKHAVSVGIGLFIAFIGLQNAKIVVNNDSTLVSMFSFKGSMADGSFKTIGITVLLALIGVLVTAILLVKNVRWYPLGYSDHMGSWHPLPVYRNLCAGCRGRLLQPSPGFFQRNLSTKHGSYFYENGFRKGILPGFCCHHVCIPVCRYV
ncbi:MAG: solute carrier family 23 protein [Blautia sp.]